MLIKMATTTLLDLTLLELSKQFYTYEQTDGRSGFSFPLRSVRGRLESVTQILGVSPKLSSSGLAFSMTNPIDSFIYQKFLLAQGSVLVPSTKFNIQIGAGRHVSHPC